MTEIDRDEVSHMIIDNDPLHVFALILVHNCTSVRNTQLQYLLTRSMPAKNCLASVKNHDALVNDCMCGQVTLAKNFRDFPSSARGHFSFREFK